MNPMAFYIQSWERDLENQLQKKYSKREEAADLLDLLNNQDHKREEKNPGAPRAESCGRDRVDLYKTSPVCKCGD